MRIQGVVFICFWVLSMASSAEIALFASTSVEYQFSNSNKYDAVGCHTHSDTYICTGDNPRAEFKVGFEYGYGEWISKWYIPIVEVGVKHRSTWTSGAPFNDESETSNDYIYVSFKIGGLR